MDKRRVQPWAAWEEEELAKSYPDYQKARRALPNRTYYAIRARARHLGLTPKRKRWRAATVNKAAALLRRMPVSEAVKHFDDETPYRVMQMVRYFKIRGRRTSFAAAGDPMLDAILQRAVEKECSLRDIDRAIGSKSYFGMRNFRNYSNARYIADAVRYLGGELHVEWED